MRIRKRAAVFLAVERVLPGHATVTRLAVAFVCVLPALSQLSHCTLSTRDILFFFTVANAVCYVDNSTGFPMPTPVDAVTGLPVCAEGFHCPGFNASNNATLPRFCTPTPECAVKRLFGEMCEAQGTQEPILCPVGHYCPTATEVLQCPEGSFCPPAMTAPLRCPALSYCPAGSSKLWYFGGLLAVLIVAALVGIAYKTYRGRLRSYPPENLADYLRYTYMPEFEKADPNPQGPAGEEQKRRAAVRILAGGFKRARGTNKPLTVRIAELHVRTAGGAEVLRGVTADFAPGKVTAIIGPGGCGKTVLLNTVLGRLPDGWARQGALSINGDASRHVSRRFRPLMGFVGQADVLHRELTVYQNLFYSARVRLPAAWPEADKDYFLSAVLEALQLTAKRDLPIGDEDTRGISGGQRRRTSIGVELVAAPMALFLDEPTSGLDSTTALEVCSCLKAIAVEARLTMAMTISQPRVEIWDALDDVLVLARGGRTAYQGPQALAQAFFAAHYAVAFPADANPADIIVDAVAARGPELADRWEGLVGSGRVGAFLASHQDVRRRVERRRSRGMSMTKDIQRFASRFAANAPVTQAANGTLREGGDGILSDTNLSKATAVDLDADSDLEVVGYASDEVLSSGDDNLSPFMNPAGGSALRPAASDTAAVSDTELDELLLGRHRRSEPPHAKNSSNPHTPNYENGTHDVELDELMSHLPRRAAPLENGAQCCSPHQSLSAAAAAMNASAEEDQNQQLLCLRSRARETSRATNSGRFPCPLPAVAGSGLDMRKQKDRTLLNLLPRVIRSVRRKSGRLLRRILNGTFLFFYCGKWGRRIHLDRMRRCGGGGGNDSTTPPSALTDEDYVRMQQKKVLNKKVSDPRNFFGVTNELCVGSDIAHSNVIDPSSSLLPGRLPVQYDDDQDDEDDDGTDEATFAGSPFWKQVLLIHNRSIAKQFSDLKPLLIETALACQVAGALGMNLMDIIPRWDFKEYPLISVSLTAFMPQFYLYIQMSVGLATSSAGVNVFVNDRETYFREAASGYSRGAYFLGCVLASQVRIAIVALLFSTAFQLIARLYIDFWLFYMAMVLSVWCTYAMSAVFAMLLSPRDAPLVAAVVSIVYACFSGFIAFPSGLKYLSHGFWASSIVQELFFAPFAHVYHSEAGEYGWPREAYGQAAGIMLGMGTLYYLIAFVLMTLVQYDKQR